jgi:hypothetical protein
MTKLNFEEPDFFINNRINEAPMRLSNTEPQRAQKQAPGVKMLTFSPDDLQQLQEELTPLEKAIDDAYMFGSNMQYSLMAWKTVEAMRAQTDEFLAERYKNDTETLKAAKMARRENIQAFLTVSALKQDIENISA